MISGTQNTSASSAQLANQSQKFPNESVTQRGGEEYQQKARSKGIPEAVIQQGKQAARKWLTENRQIADSAESSTERVSSSQKEINDKSETLLDTFV